MEISEPWSPFFGYIGKDPNMILACLFITALFLPFDFPNETIPTPLKYTQNPALRTIKPDWKGTPIDKSGRFMNHEFPFEAKFSEVLKWQFSAKPQKQEKKTDPFRLATRQDTSFLHSTEDCIVWLGHATFFIRLNGVNILIDPVFYDVPFVKRYAQHALGPEVFTQLDYLLISHDHQDHCQEKSIRAIVEKNPTITILAGLNMEGLLEPWAKNTPIQTAGWYQEYQLSRPVHLYYLPSRHWSKRSLNDTNKRLWGAFVLESNGKTLYFSGDTGYGGHFKDAKTLFPDIDICIMGVGAYKPEWFMSPNHISPQDGVVAFQDLGAKVFIPMHYGTFDLSDEPVGEPVRILKGLEKEGKIQGELKLLDLGENYAW
jgi:L-ascorbate metabolism protein UlaG (beta-lactamase superfamily)